VINKLSHEDSEAITDPDPLESAWLIASSLWETGDACQEVGPFAPLHATNPDAYLPTLGGSRSKGTLYTQLINGHPYYTQSEWSNGDRNCEMRPSAGRIAPRFGVRPHKAGASLGFVPAASDSRNPLSSATCTFGDGSKAAFFSGHAAFTRAKHRYGRAGRYTIILTLVDNRGNLNSTTRRLTTPASARCRSGLDATALPRRGNGSTVSA
jgi:PKD domain